MNLTAAWAETTNLRAASHLNELKQIGGAFLGNQPAKQRPYKKALLKPTLKRRIAPPLHKHPTNLAKNLLPWLRTMVLSCLQRSRISNEGLNMRDFYYPASTWHLFKTKMNISGRHCRSSPSAGSILNKTRLLILITSNALCFKTDNGATYFREML
jgi:hypothetical protein